jgi:hypothetical protein
MYKNEKKGFNSTVLSKQRKMQNNAYKSIVKMEAYNVLCENM